MSFTNKILIGLAAGIAVGLFLGEYAAVFQWGADAFVRLLQMTVLPYVTLSIVKSLGSLRLEHARLLGIRAGAVLAGLWTIGLGFAFLIPLAFPDVQTATFFSTSLVEQRPAFDFVALYIPSNPFNSLANNIVPAVVLFSVVVGVALIGVERKRALLDVLQVATEAVSRATRAIVKLTPYGLFAIAAAAAGTLSLEQIGRLQIYLISYVTVALLVSLWVLPGLIAALTPIGYRELFTETRDALITAFVAGDLFIVLPALIQSSQTLLDRVAPRSRAHEVPDVLVPASFNFPHTGKLLSLSFVLFAGWFADASLTLSEYPRLAIAGFLTFFGSLNAAVPFLLDLFRIPADTFQLFLASGVINARVGSLVAAVHTLTVALLGACAVAGLLRVRRAAVVRYLVVTAALSVAVVGGMRLLFAEVLRPQYSKDQVLTQMQLLQRTVPFVVHKTPPPDEAPDSRPTLERIRARGVMRVGFIPDSLPFAYYNGKGDLVGFDIDSAHKLARELGITLEFRPIDRARLAEIVATDYCDIVMSGIAQTTLRASSMLLAGPYIDETLAFVVADHERGRFATWDSIRAIPSAKILVPAVPYYVQMLQERLPGAEILPSAKVDAMFTNWDPGITAIALPAERGSAWTLLYPQFSVVVPGPGTIKIPLAFPIARRDEAFADFITTWIDLKRKDGTFEQAYDYWVLGKDRSARHPRWSIVRNVLHWVQ